MMQSQSNTQIPPPQGPTPNANMLPLPQKNFYSVEYPGYVKPTSTSQAIENLGGLRALERTFRRSAKEDSHLELKLRPEDPFAHPIPGNTASTSSILLKIVRRRKKRKDTDTETEVNYSEPFGEFTAEALGVLPKTVRFRSKRGTSPLNVGYILTASFKRHCRLSVST